MGALPDLCYRNDSRYITTSPNCVSSVSRAVAYNARGPEIKSHRDIAFFGSKTCSTVTLGSLIHT